MGRSYLLISASVGYLTLLHREIVVFSLLVLSFALLLILFKDSFFLILVLIEVAFMLVLCVLLMSSLPL